MNDRLRKATRRGMALPWVLALAAILMVMGFAGQMQVSSARKTLEKIYARRILDITANSAFEEACARLEQKIGAVPVPTHGQQRNLQDQFGGEQSIDVEQVRDNGKADNVIVGPVKVRSGKWVLDDPQHSPAGPVKLSEIGIIELEVEIKVSAGTTTIERTVTARRYAWAAPPASAPTGGQCRIAIQSYNVVYQIKEK